MFSLAMNAALFIGICSIPIFYWLCVRFNLNATPIRFFILWALTFLLEYYIFGSYSYVHVNDELDVFLSYYNYLNEFHLGGSFGHIVGGGSDVDASLSSGRQLICIDCLLMQYTPLWIAILLHKLIILSAGFIGAFLLASEVIRTSSKYSEYLELAALGVAAFFTVSNHHLIHITYGVGAGLSFMPLAIWAIFHNSNRPFLTLAISFIASIFIIPTHNLLPFATGLFVYGVVFNKLSIRSIFFFLIFILFILINWHEVMLAMMRVAPNASRGVEAVNDSFNFYEVLNYTRRAAAIWIGIAIAILLIVFRNFYDSLRLLAAYGSLFIVFIGLNLMPWNSLGLGFIARVSHWYVFLASLAFNVIALSILICCILNGRTSVNSRAINRWSRQVGWFIIAVAVAGLIYFKCVMLIHLLYNGGQAVTFSNVSLRDNEVLKLSSQFKAITLRSPDLGHEPPYTYGFYGINSFDSIMNLKPAAFNQVWKFGFNVKDGDSRLWIDRSLWDGHIYELEKAIPWPLAKTFNVGMIISPVPVSGNDFELIIGPASRPMMLNEPGKDIISRIGSRLSNIFSPPVSFVYRVKGALPFAYGAKSVETWGDVKTPSDRLKLVATRGMSKVAFVEGPVSQSMEAIGEVLVTSFERIRNGFIINVNSKNAGMLVVNLPFLPSWRAALGTTDVKIISVNVAQIGISVSPGSHRLKLVYDRAQNF